MTFLSLKGATEAEEAAKETTSGSLRAEIAKRLALGGGFTFGGAIVYGAFQLLHDNSKDAFPLLRSWGPWAFVTLVALYVVYDITKIVLNLALRAIIAWEQSAKAQQQLAEKDDRQIQELQTLTSYCSQEAERKSAEVRELADTVEKVGATIDRIEAIVKTPQPQLDVRALVAEAIVQLKAREALGG